MRLGLFIDLTSRSAQAIKLLSDGLYRLVLALCAALWLAAISACSILFDAPPAETNAEQALQRFGKTVSEQADSLAQQGSQRMDDAQAAGRRGAARLLPFSSPDAAVDRVRDWPLMRIDYIAAQHPPQLVLEGPVRGIVWLDGREIGLVQEDSVRIITLSAGEHHIRIEHPLMSAQTAQFYIESGERITLRWQQSR